MSQDPEKDLRSILLAVIDEQTPRDRISANLQSGSVLNAAAQRAGIRGNDSMEQALLTQFSELFRTGYLAWGFNISNPNPPFFHLTKSGLKALRNHSRDPGNPSGYLHHLRSGFAINDIAWSYIDEAVACYNAALPKASAVMIGAATESLILELRDAVAEKLESGNLPKGLDDWRARTVANTLSRVLDSQKKLFPKPLKESFEANWSPFTHQIRTGRNDAGHPASIEPVTQDSVHASLLIFPEFVQLHNNLVKWVREDFDNAANKALQTDKAKLSCLLHSRKPRHLAFAAELDWRPPTTKWRTAYFPRFPDAVHDRRAFSRRGSRAGVPSIS